MFCHKCGTQIAEGAAFCHGCGTKVVYVDADHPKPEDDFGASNANTDKTAPDAPAETEIPTNGPVEDVYALRAFIDNHVRAITEYQSAEELLNCEVNQTFLWICLAAPTVLLCAVGAVNGTLSLAIVPLSLGVTLILGYPLALLVDLIRSLVANERIARISEIGDVRVSGSIDTDELIEFLNQNLGYLSPHFHEWAYIRYEGFGVRGALHAAYLNAGSATRIGTAFGRKKRCFAEIHVEPDKKSTESVQTIYYFGTGMRSLWPSKYICVVKTVPILQAIMEYYIKYYRTKGEKDHVLS